jgi:hypothetical protein
MDFWLVVQTYHLEKNFVNGFRMTSHILIMENKGHVPNNQADDVLRVLTCLNPTKQ